MSTTIIHGDCIKTLEIFKDNSIDAVITDPPYFIDKLDATWDEASLALDKKNSHIKHLPKGMKFSKQQSKDFYNYYLEVSKILYEKIKPGGYFLSFSSPRLYHSMAMAMDDAGFEIRDQINWVYTQNMPKGMSVMRQIDHLDLLEEEKDVLKERFKDYKTPQLKSCFEPICVAMKPIQGTFLKNELEFNTGLLNFGEKVGTLEDKVPANLVTTDTFLSDYDKNFLVKKPVKKEKKEYNTHLSVKPVELMCHLLRLFTKENALVVDPFVGSGTTLVGCYQTKRRCVGIEKNEVYYNIAMRRIMDEDENIVVNTEL
jgi:DNA modification methylase